MKKLLLGAACLVVPLLTLAQGWPANYGGVMLQGFYWDSYSETKWSELTAQADTLSKYFNLIWVPNSGMTSTYYYDKSADHSNSNSMGYDPCFWLDHNSCWGTEDELKTMIDTYKAKNVGIIEDVVINHKNGLSGWTGFPDEDKTVNGVEYKLTWHPLQDICRNDEANSSDNSDAKGQITGADDTGDNFDGFRDLDHTSTEVQENVKTYLNYLKNVLGYAGFRYDMVKGYAPEYTKIYNESAQPEFSVGEYWDGSYNNVYTNWAAKTGDTYRSAAFDFPLKFGAILNAFQNGNFTSSANAFSNKGLAGDTQTASRYSVTFVDNHDTYRDNNKVTNNVLAANAFILALPGTPCVFWKHWADPNYQQAIKRMIIARKAAGITNQSSISEEGYDSDGDGYYMIVNGTNGKVLFIAGYMNDNKTNGFNEVQSGDNFAYYVENKVQLPKDIPGGTGDVDTPDDPVEPTADTKVNIYVQSESAPMIYAWDNNQQSVTEAFPGSLMNPVTIGGNKYYNYSSTVSPINFLLNFTGDADKSADINNVSTDKYYYFSAKNAVDVTGRNYDPVLTTASNDSVYCIVPTSDGQIYAYAWNGSSSNNGWPGTAATKVGTSGSNTIWSWSASGLDYTPANIIFDYGNGASQTADLTYTQGNTYIWDGGSKTNATSINVTPLPVFSPATVSAGRSFTSGNRSTFALPFDLTADEVAHLGGKVYKLKEYDSNGILHFEETTTVEAFHPYLFIADADVTPFTGFANRVWQSGEAVDEKSNGFHFVAHLGSRTIFKSDDTKTYYAYSGGQFYQINSNDGMNVNGYRCYFYLDKSATTAKPAGIAIDGDETTGINQIPTEKKVVDNNWYNLQGQRVSVPTRGIYIHAGKKVVIK